MGNISKRSWWHRCGAIAFACIALCVLSNLLRADAQDYPEAVTEHASARTQPATPSSALPGDHAAGNLPSMTFIPDRSVPSLTEDLRQFPVPAYREVGNYHLLTVSHIKPESDEPLVDAQAWGLACHSYYARKDGFNAPYYKALPDSSDRVYLRKSVVQKLLAVNKLLKPYGVEVLVLDGWRSIDLQKALWQYFLAEAKKVMPNATDTERITYAKNFCADPSEFNLDDQTTWVNHITGGSVDLCLRLRDSHEPLFMGSMFDEAGKLSHTDYFESVSANDSPSAVDARRNRRLLYWAMFESGFTNLPDEWWHYDYGNQLWEQMQRQLGFPVSPYHAFYGPVTCECHKPDPYWSRTSR